ncbi:glycoside hydrolase family 16 protein [Dactylonectria estremocensis]|uniref:Glycoside hydrolase family 16 protein n=1 Tax=Dactylonectria estremocensis TaxID=1079267 RepID=A0A9P9JAA9_9HYPO|nr:glycoside hydrolase family 16 protein [Dactylonectria estremocensis]
MEKQHTTLSPSTARRRRSSASGKSPSGSPVRSRSPISTALERLERSHSGSIVSFTEAPATFQTEKSSTNGYSGGTSSRPSSYYASVSSPTATTGARQDIRAARYFHSRRVKQGEVEKPWLEKTDPKEKWSTILPIAGILIGLGLASFLIWDGLRSVAHHKYCPVLDETFASGLDPSIWTKEVEVGGFGNGEFQQTTSGEENVYIDGGNLVIKATLQDANLMEKNNVIDLLEDGTCTSNKWSKCVAATNVTTRNSSVVPPAKSGRINTKKGASITYGRVEVTAKFPEGDWLWPAIWMLPVDSVYGDWPRSGEIDIAESRGNNRAYEQGGNNIVSSALNWGPNSANDAWYKINNKRQALRTTYSAGFNMFGLEWSQKYLFTYINNRLLQVTYTNFKKPMWSRGGFPEKEANGTLMDDPWAKTGHNNAPFDQAFYLVLNIAVGGTNGWFEDFKSGKPWVDGSETAKKDFWNARDQWYPTWKSPTLEVSRVVMLQQCDGDEDL